MIPVNIDGKVAKAYPGQMILEVARTHGIEIPTLCHDERLKPDGACGLCVVEVEGQERLIRACATEVNPGMIIHTHSEAVKASRRLTLELLLSDHRGDCRPPCSKACPAETDCQGYVAMIANGQYKEAVDLIKEKIALPACIGIICPHPCEDACRRQMVEEPIAIAALKAYVAEKVMQDGELDILSSPAHSGKNIAVIGSGPAGLAVAHDLALEGHRVKVYEAMPEAGGMLRYGIPHYRLPKDLLDREIALIERLGVEIQCHTRIGRDISLQYLLRHNDAVFLGIGAWESSRISCPGEDLEGVWGGIDFLREVALKGNVFPGERVVVIGGGNTAMDAARTAVRCGAREVIVAYRRTREEMPAQNIEIEEASEEGVVFKYLRSPLAIYGEQGRVKQIKLQVMELGEPDASGRRRPVPVAGQEELLPVDGVIGAIGQDVSCPFNELELDRWGQIIVDQESRMTNVPGVFAGGDAVSGPGIAIEAMAQGKKAARAINAYLAGKALVPAAMIEVERGDLGPADFAAIPREKRRHLHHEPAGERCADFRRVSHNFDDNEAREEALRCLECGCKAYFDCRLLAYSNEYQANPSSWAGDSRWEDLRENHPFLERDPAKCILCGLCVRICDEVMGVTALGFVRRGFETRVKPEFGLPWEESPCISCGQCAALCPTGAITEKYPLPKDLPVQMKENRSICTFCALGCKIKVHSVGDRVLRIYPDEGHLLCARGRFAFPLDEENRIYAPMIRQGAGFREASWAEVLQAIALKIAVLRSRYGGGALAVAASPTLTQEEFRALADYTADSLQSGHLTGFSIPPGAWDILPFMPSNHGNTLEEVERADRIIMAGSFKNSTIALTLALKGARRGAGLALLNRSGNLLSDHSQLEVHPPNSISFIWELIAALIREGLGEREIIRQELEHNPILAARVDSLPVSQEALELARFYSRDGKTMLIIDAGELTPEAILLLHYLAYLSGHDGDPRDRFIVIHPGANATGQRRAGFMKNSLELLRGAEPVKALFIFDEDPLGAGILNDNQLEQVDFLVVAASQFHATAMKADIIIPWASPLENHGTYLRCDGTSQQLEAAKVRSGSKTNLQLIQDLAREQKSFYEIAETRPEKEETNKIERQLAGGKSRVNYPLEGSLFQEYPEPHPVLIQFERKYYPD